MLIRGMTQAHTDGDRVNAVVSRISLVARTGTARDASRCNGVRTALFDRCAESLQGFDNDE